MLALGATCTRSMLPLGRRSGFPRDKHPLIQYWQVVWSISALVTAMCTRSMLLPGRRRGPFGEMKVPLTAHQWWLMEWSITAPCRPPCMRYISLVHDSGYFFAVTAQHARVPSMG